ncbi:beta-L-arabinofuranosidase domain-containing protein [Zobellia russellii]|uniref:beta-L-arabinofuranosidase domain-containing protein n=1 Tax=Zobellia russellii TaxID=248907 RepID=UPI0037DD41B3
MLYTRVIPLLFGYLISTYCFAQEPSQFHDVSLTSIEPEGWIKEFLVRQKNGLAGYPHVSGYPFNTKMWMQDIDIPVGHFGRPDWPYEQTGYYLDGILRTGYLLNDTTLINRAKKNINHVLATPNIDGILGPVNADDWSRTVFFRAIMAKYDAEPDPKILERLTDHYLKKPRLFNEGRALMSIEQILWLYKKINDPRLLKLAENSFSNNQSNAVGGEYTEENKSTQPQSKILDQLLSDAIPSGHGVTFAEQVKIPAILYLHTGKQKYLDASINGLKKLKTHHLLVDGVPSSVEHLNGKSVSMAHETCDIVDLTWSLGYIMMATREGYWGDWIEKAFFNAGLGALEKNFKGHQYYSAPNQPIAAENTSQFNINSNWGGMATGRMCYRTSHDTECCTGNIQRMMPSYASRMWLKDNENNIIVAALYGPSNFKTDLNGKRISIKETTQYPFSEQIKFEISVETPTTFTLMLRKPAWCKKPIVQVNGKKVSKFKINKGFIEIKQKIKNSSIVELELPMLTQITRTGIEQEGISIERGPLLYALPIQHKTTTFPYIGAANVENFPNQLMYPTSNWSYALDTTDISIVENEINGKYPWDLKNTPNRLRLRAKQITNWKLDGSKHLTTWPKTPEFKPDFETIELVPIGATYLRMSILPKAE